MTSLPSPHGGHLSELLAAPADAEQLKIQSRDFPSWDLNSRQLNELELLLNGAFSPLTGYLSEADYNSVLQRGRLTNGLLWPIPICLDVTQEFSGRLAPDQYVALRDKEGVLLAVMQVTDIWRPDKSLEAMQIYGVEDSRHPEVHYLLNNVHPVYLGGRIFGIELPVHYDFAHLRLTPRAAREAFDRAGWSRTLGAHTQQPMHRAQIEAAMLAASRANARLFIQPLAGLSNPGDTGHYTQVRCYEQALRYYPEGSALLALLPLPPRHAGLRETLLYAIIRKNFGCTHILMMDTPDQPPHADQQDLGIEFCPVPDMIYVEQRAEYLPGDEITPAQRTLTLSNTELAVMLAESREIPLWFSYPEIIAELRRAHLPRNRQGVTVFFTGLSGSGKSTLAKALLAKLMEIGERTVSLLDGDVVRKHLSSELGFSREHRNVNILRIGFVASEITKHGGIAICAPIAPYAATRRQVREMVTAQGGFIEIYVSTPLEVCEERDRKGLYAKARAGVLKEFTGISDPYEIPDDAEIVIDTRKYSPLQATQVILDKLTAAGYLR